MEVRREEVSIVDEEAFTSDPLNVMRIFVESQRNQRHLNSRALRTVRKHAPLITAKVRQSRPANALFLELLRSPRNVTTALPSAGTTIVVSGSSPAPICAAAPSTVTVPVMRMIRAGGASGRGPSWP